MSALLRSILSTLRRAFDGICSARVAMGSARLAGSERPTVFGVHALKRFHVAQHAGREPPGSLETPASIKCLPRVSPRTPSPWLCRLQAVHYAAVTDSGAPGRASSGIKSPRYVLLVTALGNSCCCSSLKQQLSRFEEV